MGATLVPAMLMLDSWPVLEWIKGRQPAYQGFVELAKSAMDGQAAFHMSRINYGEAIYSIRKAPEINDVAGALKKLHAAPIYLHTVDDVLVDEAVELKSRYSFAFADAFAAALSIRLGAELVTGDREFLHLEADGLVKLRWLGA